jgi:chemotaxis protein MotA
MLKTARSTIVGFAIGIVCIVFSIMGAGELKSFWNLPSVFITIGGTLGAVIVSFPFKQLKTLGGVIKKAFRKEEHDVTNDIQVILNISETIRREGLLAMEDRIDEFTDDEFLKKGVLLLIDGTDKRMIKTIMKTELYAIQKRHRQGYSMLDLIAATAPALGLLGTYIGLIPMLQNLDDPTKLGPLMAVELVTSFYGAFLAYVVFAPMSKRLKIMSSDELARKGMMLNGILAIQDGQHPRLIQENMVAYLAKAEAKNMSARRGKRKEQEEQGEPAGYSKKVISFGRK